MSIQLKEWMNIRWVRLKCRNTVNLQWLPYRYADSSSKSGEESAYLPYLSARALIVLMCSEESSYTLFCSVSIPLKIPWSRLLFEGASLKTLRLIVNGQKHYTRDMSRCMTCIITCITWCIGKIYCQCASFLFYFIFSVPMDTLCSEIKICYVILCYNQGVNVNLNVNVHVYSPDIPVGSADCTIYTPGI